MDKTKLMFDRPLLLAAMIALAGISQFLYFAPQAMRAYPGGTIYNQQTFGYSWKKNWLSDLGRTKAWNGKPNTESARTFNTSVIVLGVSLIVFFVASVRAHEETSIAAWTTTVAGATSGAGLIGIGLTPFDRFEPAHLASLFLWIVPMLVAAATLSIEAQRSGSLTAAVFPAAGWLLLIAVIGYAISSTTSHVMAVQKLVVLLSIGWLATLVWRVGLAAVWLIADARGRIQVVNQQAGRYIRELEKGHLKPHQKLDD